jgi:hypothetical protein
MLAMRPAVASDVAAVEAMIYARCGWLEERGLPSWRALAPDLAAQAGSGSGAMWVLEDEGGRIVGCTTLLTSTPPWGRTEQELAEPAYYLYTSATDPAYQAIRPGSLMPGGRWTRRPATAGTGCGAGAYSPAWCGTTEGRASPWCMRYSAPTTASTSWVGALRCCRSWWRRSPPIIR